MRCYLIGQTAAEMVGTRCAWPRTALRARAGPRAHRVMGANLAIVLVRGAHAMDPLTMTQALRTCRLQAYPRPPRTRPAPVACFLLSSSPSFFG